MWLDGNDSGLLNAVIMFKEVLHCNICEGYTRYVCFGPIRTAGWMYCTFTEPTQTHPFHKCSLHGEGDRCSCLWSHHRPLHSGMDHLVYKLRGTQYQNTTCKRPTQTTDPAGVCMTHRPMRVAGVCVTHRPMTVAGVCVTHRPMTVAGVCMTHRPLTVAGVCM